MTVNDVELTERILRQGKALVRAIQALETIECVAHIERPQTRFHQRPMDAPGERAWRPATHRRWGSFSPLYPPEDTETLAGKHGETA